MLNGTHEFSEVAYNQNSPDYRLEPLSFPAPDGQSAEIWKWVVGKVLAQGLDLFLKLVRASSFELARADQWKMTLDLR